MGWRPSFPIYLGEVRAAGLTLCVRCPLCMHAVDLPAADLKLPDDLDMNAVGHRLRCTSCGRRGGHTIYPDHKPWVRHLRATGQRDRLPWFAPMIRDEPS